MQKLVLICFIFLAAIAPLAGQTATGRIEGTVQDPSGAAVPEAKVTAVNSKTSAKSEVATTRDGNFVIAALPPGLYNMTVEANGFRRADIRGVELNVSATVTQVVRLELGQTSESVTVEANAVSVQTSESQVSRAVTMRDIDSLPQLTRNPVMLAVFQPGVQIDVRVSSGGQDASFSHVNGLRQGSNNNRVDGIEANDPVVPRLGLALTANNPDAIGEFRIVTTGGKAEYGRNAGAQVELVTRTGTNQFHGNLFDFLRNTALNANDFFNNQSGGDRPKFIQNIFGGSFGGPVALPKLYDGHDKTFFFFNYQGTRTRQEVIRTQTVLSPEARRGIFRWRQNGAIQSYDIAANDPRHIGVDPAVAKIFATLPAPNNSDVGDGLNTVGYRFNNPSPAVNDQYTIRIDHNLTSNNRVFFRVSRQTADSVDSLNGADPTYPGFPSGRIVNDRLAFAAGSDWNVRPTLINEFRIGRQSAAADFLRPGRIKGPTYITNLLFPDPYNASFGQGRNAPVLDITENLTWVRNHHTLKGGASLRFINQYGWNEAGIYPNATTTTGNGNSVPAAIGPQGLSAADRSIFDQLYNDVLGRVDVITQTFYSNLEQFQPGGTPRIRNQVIKESGYFFQDDWRLRRNLTLNLGVRYEFFAVPHERDGIQGVLDQAQLVNGVTPATSLTIQRSSRWYANDWNNFAPRAGFAWDVAGNGKTSIRGNWGMFYDRAIGSVINTADGSTPGFSQTVRTFPNQTGSDLRFSDAGLPYPQQPAAPVLNLPQTRSTSVVLFDPNLRTGYVHSWAIGVQREIAANTILEVNYVGNRGIKLFMTRDVNQPRIYDDFLGAFKELQGYVNDPNAPVSASNTLARLYGSPANAVNALGGRTIFTQGRAGTAANSLDVNSSNFNRYAAAGLPPTYLRLYPQFNQVVLGTNDGRSYYNSMQVSVRRSAGALRMAANYTFSKSIDNGSGEGNGFGGTANPAPVDSMNLRLNRGRSDFDRPHSFNASAIYAIPFGKGKRFGGDLPKWADAAIGGWEIGSLWVWQSGQTFSVSSQRATTAISGVGSSFANYTGTDRNIGSLDKRGDGVYFFTPSEAALFTYPGAGEVGNSGRNVFRGPRFFNIDASLVKKFKVTERSSVGFRAEAFNLTNHADFAFLPANLNINIPGSFGKFSGTVGTQNTTTSARIMQLALRFDF